MKNFNFSVIAALYIFLVGWFFTHSGNNVQKFLMFSIVASPLVWLAFYAQGKRIGGFSELNLKSLPVLSHLTALAAAVFMFLFVKEVSLTPQRGRVLGPVLFFGNFQVGWDLDKGVRLLAILIVATASALTIWTGFAFSGKKRKSLGGKAPRLFFAGLPEITRLLLNVYFVTFLWALGTLAVSIVYKDNVRHLTIVTARAMLPLFLLVPFAIMRLPGMGIASLVAAGVTVYLIKANSTLGVAAVFMAPPAVVLAAFMGIRYFTVPAFDGEPAPAAVEIAAPDNSSPQADVNDGEQKDE